ncbi:helix-turn-helix domain-containing protein [Deefgea piscis]|uniref:helix-turn-helix domain-containing protein n=1 Tax=Deefgea piscis TaxID=2739061 RepID=UPI001C80936C|nr:AraC family transcriptional regulator [Deefgea piscis]QZA82145.1 AraC family transcriptional regulator [Deefgea piscis]
MSARQHQTVQLRYLQGLYVRYRDRPALLSELEYLFGLRPVASDNLSEIAAESALQLNEYLHAMGDPHAMSWVASQIDLAAGDGFIYYLRSANTLEMAIAELSRFAAMLFPDGDMRVVTEAEQWQIQLSPLPQFDRLGGLLRYEAIVVWLIRAVSCILGADIRPLSVQVMTSKMDSTELETICAAPIAYQAECFSVAWPSSYLQSKLPGFSASLHSTLQAMFNQRLQHFQAQHTLLWRTWQHLARGQQLAWADLANTAHALGLSSASFRRQLSLEGTSFRQISVQMKRNRAIHALLDPKVRLEDLAHSLGFAERSTFERAFGLWFTWSPSQFRRELKRSFPSRASAKWHVAEAWSFAECHSERLDAALDQELVVLSKLAPYWLDNPKHTALLLVELNLLEIDFKKGMHEFAKFEYSLEPYTYRNLLCSSRGVPQSLGQEQYQRALLVSHFSRAVLEDCAFATLDVEHGLMVWAAYFHRLATPLENLPFAEHCRRSALLLILWGVNPEVLTYLLRWSSNATLVSAYLEHALDYLSARLDQQSLAYDCWRVEFGQQDKIYSQWDLLLKQIQNRLE